MFQLCSDASVQGYHPSSSTLLLNKCLLDIDYVPNIVSGAGNIAKNKCLKVLTEMSFLKVPPKVVSLSLPVHTLSLCSLFVLFISSFSNLFVILFLFSLLRLSSKKAGRVYLLLSPLHHV